ncbi:Glutamyl-tRNA(Gln) amidotransferase subunit A [Bhargavaea cecembensis DSE10]|uniref:Glutamyl-tRNA(Gln) amidotransferase subunit A n=1 Tax=Bhargavaea cecembensis DSE10 TaxID=1235279 RepID=M7P4K2_9BACL|nr:amidase family protein [Bhargavaea cecembensis]EMR05459.1 Glutamyl-tRNA(Gln) amidotransferase subunit A [Bhargavaea cecembensis DSE10]
MQNERLERIRDEWLEEASIREMQEKMEKGDVTAEELTVMYLSRISEYGRNVNAVLEVNPDALQIARQLDYERQVKGARSPLHGIPVLLKDNMDTGDKMHTSCGSLALADHYAAEDAFLVKKLREAGAVILGKTNMTEWANFMSDKMTNGYSSRGGQVKSPYGQFDCGGSSSGAAVAVAANLAAASVGTETTGSIIEPAVQNSLVGIKPTVGAISRAGVIPLSVTQDIPGPLARDVESALLMFREMVGEDPADPVTSLSDVWEGRDWEACLDPDALNGARIGVARNIFENEADSRIQDLFDRKLDVLKACGAEIIDDIDLGVMENDLGYDVLMHEFKAAVNAYLGKTPASNPIRTLSDVIEFNSQHPEETLKFGQNMLEQSDRTSGTLTERAYLEALERNRHLSSEVALERAFREHDISALVFPQSHGLSFGAAAGYPGVAVPAGKTEEGEPFGIAFYGRAFAEPLLIGFACAFEQREKGRVKPPNE